jgi:hypothetical protein
LLGDLSAGTAAMTIFFHLNPNSLLKNVPQKTWRRKDHQSGYQEGKVIIPLICFTFANAVDLSKDTTCCVYRCLLHVLERSLERISKDRQDRDKGTNNDLQNTAKKTKYWATRILLKTGVELGCSWMVSSYCTTSGIKDEPNIVNADISAEITTRNKKVKTCNLTTCTTRTLLKHRKGGQFLLHLKFNRWVVRVVGGDYIHFMLE